MSSNRRFVVGGALALAGLLVGSSPALAAPNDAALQGRIENDLQGALDRDADVTVDVADGKATLTGVAVTVHASREAERRASKLAREVDNQIRVVPEEARSEREIREDVVKAILRDPYYGIFDSVELGVSDGVVVLQGSVYQPIRKTNIDNHVAKVAGVREIHNEIAVQSVSIHDDRLRLELARAIYRDPRFFQYAHRVNPPIHIVVDRGHVTLTGVVSSRVEQALLGHIARGSLAFSVENRLEVEGEQEKEPGSTTRS